MLQDRGVLTADGTISLPAAAAACLKDNSSNCCEDTDSKERQIRMARKLIKLMYFYPLVTS